MILLPRFHVGNHLSKSPLKIKPHRQKQERENCSPSGGEKELLGFYGRPRGILPRCSPRGKAASQLPAVTTKWGTKREPVTQKPPPWAQTPSSPLLFCVSVFEHINYTARCATGTLHLSCVVSEMSTSCTSISMYLCLHLHWYPHWHGSKAELCEAVEWEAASVHNGWWFCSVPSSAEVPEHPSSPKCTSPNMQW